MALWSVKIHDFERGDDGSVFYVIQVVALSERGTSEPFTWYVRRRYSHFLAFRKALRKAYPTCLIPPLPPKTDLLAAVRQHVSPPRIVTRDSNAVAHIFPSGRRDPKLIDSRCHGLQTFLFHILCHRRLKEDLLVNLFLKSSDDWTTQLQKSIYCIGTDLFGASPTANSNPLSNVDPGSSALTPEVLLEQYLPAGIQSNLMENRASSLQTVFQNLFNLQQTLIKLSIHTHRLYKEYAEAFFRWSAQDITVPAVANAIQMFGHELDRYSYVMDPAYEEEADLDDQLGVWQEYGGCLTEVHQAYKSAQATLESARQQAAKVAKSNSSHRKSISSNVGAASTASPSSGPVEHFQSLKVATGRISHEVLGEILDFEQFYQANLIYMFHTYACLQFRRAERCRKIWERITGGLKRALENLGDK
ncbi:unnamed protein product [Calicophoron daubneyi]|uniref:PX domain-containing protein n=1 Tax=Calicophoron daubneyi TaxID=300641 RepID=A0AAV2T3D2_CALDB